MTDTDKTNLRENLSTNRMAVTFLKVDGTHRSMVCTRNMGIIPVESHPKGTGTEGSDAVLRVYDLDSNAWKSFIFENVISAEILA